MRRQEYNALLRALAQQYVAEFPKAGLDPRWSETAYEDFPGTAQAAVSWEQFHEDLSNEVKALDD